jgi:hypothetical protein
VGIQKSPDERDLRYFKLITGRLEKIEDEDIAEALGFGSPTALYQQIRADGHSICPICGTTYVEDEHCKQTEKKRSGSAKGEQIELPPAKEAAPLFRGALDKLLEAVEFLQSDYESDSSSRYTKEYLQGKLFFQYTREDIHWAPDLGGRTWRSSARRLPGNWLTELIAAYLLVGGDPEPLTKKLHLNPDSLNREKLRKHIEGHRTPTGRKPGLLGSAEDVAILIRGGILDPGPRAGEFDVDEQFIHQLALQGQQEGYSDQQIVERLSEEGISSSKAEIERLRSKNIPGPSS